MNHVERFNATMSFEPVDRLPMIEWAGWWDKTLARWRSEGLPDEPSDYVEIRVSLGLDPYGQEWIQPMSSDCPEPSHHGAGLVKDDAEYEAFLQYLYPSQTFESEHFGQWKQRHNSGELVMWLTVLGFFWFPRTLFGIEDHFYAFYDHPDLMHRMNRDVLEFNKRSIDAYCRNVGVPEFLTLAEDMSYNHGPMLSKDLFDEFLAPYYRELSAYLKERGILFIVDSDGDVTEMIPWLKEVGVDGLLPWEKQSGIDIAQIRRDHPRFRIIGAYDKMVMWHGEEAIRAEFERLLPVMKTGGFIPSVDHQTPPGVSLEQYHVYVRLLKEYCCACVRECAGNSSPLQHAVQV